MIRKLLVFSLLSICSFAMNAQNESDILRYSNLIPYGNARFSSMGGAFSALGGNITVMAYNPAGTGVYRSSDINMTLAWSSNNTKTNYNGTELEADRSNVHLSNIGFVIANPFPEDSDWKYVNAGISYNQLANFSRDINIEGVNNENSYLDIETYNLNNGFSDPDYNLYFQSGVVFYDTVAGSYFNDYERGYGTNASKTIREQGKVGEWDFNMSANYKDFLYIGATIGVVSVRYEQTTDYSETPTNIIPLVNFNATDYFQTKGTGVNFKMGLIYKPVQALRFGLAVHTRTVYNLQDTYYSNVDGVLDIDGSIIRTGSRSPDGMSSWSGDKPFVLIGSGAIVLGKIATVSAEVEMQDYSKMNLSADDYDFKSENTSIKKTYRRTYNVRTGTEVRFGMASIRGGFAYYQSPYKEGYVNSYAHTYQVSGGAGLNTGSLYFDIAYIHRFQNEKYSLYDASNTMVDMTHNNGSFMVSAGCRF